MKLIMMLMFLLSMNSFARNDCGGLGRHLDRGYCVNNFLAGGLAQKIRARAGLPTTITRVRHAQPQSRVQVQIQGVQQGASNVQFHNPQQGLQNSQIQNGQQISQQVQQVQQQQQQQQQQQSGVNKNHDSPHNGGQFLSQPQVLPQGQQHYAAASSTGTNIVCYTNNKVTDVTPRFVAPVRTALIGAFALNPRAARRQLDRNIASRNGVAQQQITHQQICTQQATSQLGEHGPEYASSSQNYQNPYAHQQYDSARSPANSRFNLNIQGPRGGGIHIATGTNHY